MVLPCWRISLARQGEPEGVLPAAADGRPLNFDFELGSLADWTAEGPAFAGQPVRGDAVAARRSDMKSEHQGEFLVGSFEKGGDEPRGTLTSVPFRVSHPWAGFLVGGGQHRETAVELIRADGDGTPFYRATGDDTETLKRVAVDLTPHQGREIFIRLVDDRSDGWGHINFDDFRFYDAKPPTPARNVLGQQDEYAHAGLSPEEAAKAMTVPEGFRVTLGAGEPDVVRPIAMAIDERGRIWVAENHAYPFKVAPEEARDRILIFEDTNGDGRLDKRTLFHEGLNMVTGLEVGFGGVWVGAAPELLFIPDKDGDDRPDGPPVVLLDGWGLEDTHETLNSFMWGPDGWLYGTHGVFTHSRVGKPGTPDDRRVPINAGIWRYHPQKERFEVFAEGTSNPWGLDFDDRGEAFIEACVIPHFFHIIQSARYQRQAGQHFNPYTYADIQHHGDHVHYLGDNPHRGNDRSDAAGGGHAHSGLMVYLGGTWPKEYHNTLFMNNIHGARLNNDAAEPVGSGFVGRHRPDFLRANDRASQILDMRYGPDGNVWMIDWYDIQQCHRPDASAHDKEKGRIFKISYGDANPVKVDLGRLTTEQLIFQLGLPNAWSARQARRLLQERGLDEKGRAILAGIVFDEFDVPTQVGGGLGAGPVPSAKARPSERHRLQALWALHAAGGLDEDMIARGLTSDSPYVRAWTIQLACEDMNPSSATLAKFGELAKSDPSPVVRRYLASALARLPLEKRWDTLRGLLSHAEDADDHNLPLLYWYAAEPLGGVDSPTDRQMALVLAAESKVPILLPFMTRRVAAQGNDAAIAQVVNTVAGAEPAEARATILGALNEALQGRRRVAMPANWPQLFAVLAKDSNADVRSRAIALGTTFGDAGAMAVLRQVLDDADAPEAGRREALAALLKARDPELPGRLRGLVGDPNSRGLRSAAIRGLAAFDDPETPADLVKVYADLGPAERRDALATFASRPAYGRALLDAVEAKAVPASEVTAQLVRDLRNLKDDSLNARIAEVWGTARETPAEKAELAARYRAIVRKGYQVPPDLGMGRDVYARTCGQCHILFGTGGDIGPDLTGSNRADLEYILENVVDPSALVGKDYQATVIATADGRVLTGIVKQEDDDAITLATANETVIVPKADVDERMLTEQSLMPEDQWANLSEFEIRSLVAYLASPGQVPRLATAENAELFFNGRDLSGWQGDPELWSVQDGEIVGKSAGIDHNSFLRSDLAAGDFRFSCEVKLVDDAGNSGIQFRSEALPEGEVRGYQADVGPGWWGKLYEEHGRELLWDESGERHVKKGEWNRYEIEAVGPRIVTRINGQVCVDLDDPRGARRGIFALQLHSGGATEVRFRDLKLEVAEPPARAGGE